MFGTAVKKNEQLLSTLHSRATGMRRPSRTAPPPLPPPVAEIPEEEPKPMPASHLHLAVQEGHINSVRFLLDQDDTDLFAVDSFGNTALHSALESGHEIMAALLIQVQPSPPTALLVKIDRCSQSMDRMPPRFRRAPSQARSERTSFSMSVGSYTLHTYIHIAAGPYHQPSHVKCFHRFGLADLYSGWCR
ncbi:hypothetical protein T484DRAFT_3526197 [Baffinella frigidus]|nr:hypothetical protein T484DRAFT_3526197 [Cryptophyta sp. CCMP2293]